MRRFLPSRQPAAPPGALTIVALASAALLGFLNGSSLSPFLPEIAADLDTTVPRLGQVMAVTFAVAAGVGLVAGPFADARGSRRLLQAGLVAAAVAALGTAVAWDIWSLLASRLSGALSAGILLGVSLGVASSRFEGPMQRRAISWVGSGIAGGAIAGIPFLTLVGSLLGWRAAFVALAGLSILVLLVLRVALADDTVQSVFSIRRIGHAYVPLARDSTMLVLYGASALRSLCWMGFLVYAGTFFAEEHGLSTRGVGWVYMIGGLGFFIGTRAAGGRLGDRPLRELFVMTTLVVGACVGAVLVLPVGLAPAVLLTTVASTVLGVSGVCLITLLARETPAGRGTTMSLNATIMELGTAGGGSFGGLLLSAGGFSLLGLGLPVVAFASAALVVLGMISASRVRTAEPAT